MRRRYRSVEEEINGLVPPAAQGLDICDITEDLVLLPQSGALDHPHAHSPTHVPRLGLVPAVPDHSDAPAQQGSCPDPLGDVADEAVAVAVRRLLVEFVGSKEVDDVVVRNVGEKRRLLPDMLMADAVFSSGRHEGPGGRRVTGQPLTPCGGDVEEPRLHELSAIRGVCENRARHLRLRECCGTLC